VSDVRISAGLLGIGEHSRLRGSVRCYMAVIGRVCWYREVEHVYGAVSYTMFCGMTADCSEQAMAITWPDTSRAK
jgi:hypothetical protein